MLQALKSVPIGKFPRQTPAFLAPFVELQDTFREGPSVWLSVYLSNDSTPVRKHV